MNPIDPPANGHTIWIAGLAYAECCDRVTTAIFTGDGSLVTRQGERQAARDRFADLCLGETRRWPAELCAEVASGPQESWIGNEVKAKEIRP